MYSLRIQRVSTFRGVATDHSGRSLAVNVPVKTIWADPKEVHDAGDISVGDRWKALANALNIPLDQLSVHINANPKGRFIYLMCRVNLDMAEHIKKLKLLRIHLREESRRYYPSGEVATHLIGLINIGSQGIEGIEKSFGKQLTGQPGERIVRRDRYGRVTEDTSPTDNQAAHNLTPSTDECLQTSVYRELNNAIASNKAGSGSTVLADVNTGEVLTMANSPSCDPNNLSGTLKEAVRNHTTANVSEPGSMVKPMVVMTALQHGVVQENLVLDTIPYRISDYEIKDAARYSELTLTGVLQKPSNVGVSKLVLAVPSLALTDTYSRSGLGKAINLGLVGKRSGLYSRKQRWSDIERATFSFGYGLIAIPLQLVRVYATIDNYDIYRSLSITKVDPPAPGKRVFPESIVRTMVHMMESVALPDGGDAKAATKSYRIAIKAGTVKRVRPDDRHTSKYVAYTAGVTPVSRSRFALVVVINSSQAGKYYGGAVSTPVFSVIMGDVLHIMGTEPDVLTAGDRNEFVINQGEGTGGRS